MPAITPRQVVEAWIHAFNAADSQALAERRAAIQAMFEASFKIADDDILTPATRTSRRGARNRDRRPAPRHAGRGRGAFRPG